MTSRNGLPIILACSATTTSGAALPGRRGLATYYVIIMLVTLVAFCSLGVDYGRVQLAKSELQTATDAAARAGASGLASSTSTARNRAASAAAANECQGESVVINKTADIQLGLWDVANATFTPLSGNAQSSSNAVRVTARRIGGRNNAIPLTFAAIIGLSTFDLETVSTAHYIAPLNSQNTIGAIRNPWLAGMPNGTIANPGNPAGNPDRAPNQSPIAITSIPLIAGTAMTFDSINGGANNDARWPDRFTADGNLDWVIDNFGGAEHGKSNITCPINALIGVFLTDAQPNLTSPPASLDYSTSQSRDFTTSTPQLKQVFFIGDGRTSDGTVQKFIIPPGATRFYLGTMDGWEWNNNVGSYTTTTIRPAQVKTVK